MQVTLEKLEACIVTGEELNSWAFLTQHSSGPDLHYKLYLFNFDRVYALIVLY